jgi:proteasome assembly chaperone (PAC2) family protein
MQSAHLELSQDGAQLSASTLVIGFSGWMNGGNVSLGVVEYLRRQTGALRIGWIDPDAFYIYSFPGSMEVSAIFRPHVNIEDGLIAEFDPPENVFFASPSDNLVFFEGKEPNVRWSAFADCILEVVEACDVRRIYFVGSVSGVVPHTRDPRIGASVSLPAMKEDLAELGLRWSNYEGPASFVTYLTRLCGRRNLELAALVAEIPAYIQGPNPRSIEGLARRMAAILQTEMEFDDLRRISDVFERRVSEVIAEKPELSELIEKLEGDYDNDMFESEMGDLKIWLQQQGIRVD